MVPLGDQAVLVSFHDEDAALGFAARVRGAKPPGLGDGGQAYARVGGFYDADRGNQAAVVTALQTVAAPGETPRAPAPGRLHVIPCCYEKGLDLQRVAAHTALEPEMVIRLHAEAVYTVYAIGFCPGFPYLGYLPPRL